MKILIIGAGAVGGYFGARLQHAGRDVTFLVHSKRGEQLRHNGLHVVSPLGDVSVQPRLVSAEALKNADRIFDLILLSTKAYSLQAAMDDFAPAVGKNTLILPLLNGMRHLELLIKRFGRAHVLGGSTRVVADLDPDGRVLHLEPLHDLVFGELTREITPRVQAVANTLANAGFDDVLSHNVLAFMWQKWVLLAAMGAITCLMRGSVGEVVSVAGGAETARSIIAECVAIAHAEGYMPPPTFMETVNARLTEAGSVLTASMYRDLHKGQPVEADQILGDLIAHGDKHGFHSPLLRAAYVQLAIYQARLTS